MTTAVEETLETSNKLNINLRLASYINAISKIHKCYEEGSILDR